MREALLLLCVVGLSASPAFAASNRYCYAGEPVAAESIRGDMVILTNKAFLVGYDEKRQGPAWVAYRLFHQDPRPSTVRRTRFNTDMRTRSKVSEKDYRHSGYTRGHMAPSYAMAICYGKEGQKEAFLMSNVTPQVAALNGGPWSALEIRILDEFLPEAGELWVLAGTVYDDRTERLEAGPEVPDACFKIILAMDSGRPRTLAFLMTQEPGNEKLEHYLVSIDEIERRTGLDFFTGLPDKLEAETEATAATTLW